MKDEYLKRTIGLLGEDNASKLSEITVLVCGLGGVGGTALEALARSGIKHFIIVDFDVVDPSNLNRQILYGEKDLRLLKVECAKQHILNIDNSISMVSMNSKIDDSIGTALDHFEIDYIVDAIDDVKGKIALAKYASKKNIPHIMSLGMANRLDPTKVVIERLDKTTDDPLARKIRYEFKKEGIETNKIICAVSKEKPQKDGVNLNSMMLVPSSAGLAIAYQVISHFIK